MYNIVFDVKVLMALKHVFRTQRLNISFQVLKYLLYVEASSSLYHETQSYELKNSNVTSVFISPNGDILKLCY